MPVEYTIVIEVNTLFNIFSKSKYFTTVVSGKNILSLKLANVNFVHNVLVDAANSYIDLVEAHLSAC
jgi:hypothetical protein